MAVPRQAPDPLAGLEESKPVVIEDFERRREARRRFLDLTTTVRLDIGLLSWLLLAAAFWLAVAGILVIPHLPGVMRPYSMTARLLLLALACATSGRLLLRASLALIQSERAGEHHGE